MEEKKRLSSQQEQAQRMKTQQPLQPKTNPDSSQKQMAVKDLTSCLIGGAPPKQPPTNLSSHYPVDGKISSTSQMPNFSGEGFRTVTSPTYGGAMQGSFRSNAAANSMAYGASTLNGTGTAQFNNSQVFAQQTFSQPPNMYDGGFGSFQQAGFATNPTVTSQKNMAALDNLFGASQRPPSINQLAQQCLNTQSTTVMQQSMTGNQTFHSPTQPGLMGMAGNQQMTAGQQTVMGQQSMMGLMQPQKPTQQQKLVDEFADIFG